VFTTPRARADTLESNDSDEASPRPPTAGNNSEEPSPDSDIQVPDPDLQLDTDIITAGIQFALDIQEREPADPLDPNRPAQLIQTAGAVISETETTTFTTAHHIRIQSGYCISRTSTTEIQF
jgi:hypothetical protein